jgi:hypothetical protein
MSKRTVLAAAAAIAIAASLMTATTGSAFANEGREPVHKSIFCLLFPPCWFMHHHDQDWDKHHHRDRDRDRDGMK